jgi:ornithine carbamoyltransferase
MYEEMKQRNEKESDFTKNKQKTRVSLDVALDELGGQKE